ncbi:MAG: DUF58 domain-containing protein [Burkholderiales bacterium]
MNHPSIQRESLQKKINAWMLSRQPRTDKQRLTHRNVYILPTRPGLFFVFTMGLLLIASINYQLNLGYALTFLLSGSALVSMHLTHSTLRGLMLHLRPVAPTFAKQKALLQAMLEDSGGRTPRDRYGIGLRLKGSSKESVSWIDILAHEQTVVDLFFIPQERGWQDIPAWVAETQFPLGLFRAWTIWRPKAKVLVYPEPESSAPVLPPVGPLPGVNTPTLAAKAQSQGQSEPDGIRAYQPGDPIRHILWKKSAKALASGAELVSREAGSTGSSSVLWLDWYECDGLSAEARLSRLTAWVLMADQMGRRYGLRLPHFELPAGSGDAHRQQALQALALWS